MKKVFMIMLLALNLYATSTINDKVSLKGLEKVKIIFDINIANVKKMPLYLNVIMQTYEGLKKQNVTPDIILAFRGLAVNFLVKDDTQKEIETLLKQLIQKSGVKVEACNVAAQLFEVDTSNYFEGVQPVGNTFISLGAYQAKGYAIIPLY